MTYWGSPKLHKVKKIQIRGHSCLSGSCHGLLVGVEAAVHSCLLLLSLQNVTSKGQWCFKALVFFQIWRLVGSSGRDSSWLQWKNSLFRSPTSSSRAAPPRAGMASLLCQLRFPTSAHNRHGTPHTAWRALSGVGLCTVELLQAASCSQEVASV